MSKNVIVFEVPERDVYVFGDEATAEAFEDAYNTAAADLHVACGEEVAPIEPGQFAEEIIAAERGSAIENLDYAPEGVSGEIERGVSPRELLVVHSEIPGSATPGHAAFLRVLAEWAEMDEQRIKAREPRVIDPIDDHPSAHAGEVAETMPADVVARLSAAAVDEIWEAQGDANERAPLPAAGDMGTSDGLGREGIGAGTIGALRETAGLHALSEITALGRFAEGAEFNRAEALQEAKHVHLTCADEDAARLAELVDYLAEPDASPGQITAAEMREECGYDEYEDCGVDALIDYKNGCEERMIEMIDGAGEACRKIAAFMARPGDWNGGDVCDVVATALIEAGYLTKEQCNN